MTIMEGLNHWNSRLLKSSILCLIILIQSTSAQEGFTSINCCADSNITDPHTNLLYIPDDKWFPDKKNCNNLPKPENNSTEYDKTRIFILPPVVYKTCYKLATTRDRDYLIRSTFIFNDPYSIATGSSFDVLIGATMISHVNSTVNPTVVAGIFKATNDFVDFCLVKEIQNPYMSQLELRPLINSGYLDNDSSVLKVVGSYDVQNGEIGTRYPQDLNDRLWKTRQSNTSTATNIAPAIDMPSANITVPFQVLQSALTDQQRLEFIHRDLSPGVQNYTIFLYFLELNDTIGPGQRVFDIYINNKTRQTDFDILKNGSKYSQTVLSVVANGILNLTLVKASNGLVGPICNAYEIFQVQSRVQETSPLEVKAILEVKDELVSNSNKVFDSWNGDPCNPKQWPGLDCDVVNGSLVITKLNLSSSKLQGPIPASIVKLINLKELNLSYNSFSGNIPNFQVPSMLDSIDVSNNTLEGLIPDSLLLLPNLLTLYYGCNRNLKLPSGSNRTKLKTDKGRCGSESKDVPKMLKVTVVSGTILFIVAAITMLGWLCRRKIRLRRSFNEREYPLTKNAVFSISSMDDIVLTSILIKTFTLEQIESATHRYRTLIGEGGFGSVYRGTLLDGQEVAVKVRSATSTQGTREFENELNLLSNIRHENLVPLLGSCTEKDQQILVYPFMSNGSLQDRLYGEAAKRKILDWPTRLSIALGAARGLLYLHTFSGRSLIHRDVKSSNILLDQSMCAKVADFGFSKYAPQDGDSGVSLEVRGTAGYLDPEYYSTQHLSAKSDVFSFGVVLLEIISGREPLNIHRPRNEWSLIEWAKPYIRDSKIEEIVDPNIKGGYHAEAVWRVVEVALGCIEPFSAYRPCMADIVRELEDALIIENNASEYMRSIDSFGGSNRFSIERSRIALPTMTPSQTDPSPITSQAMDTPKPR